MSAEPSVPVAADVEQVTNVMSLLAAYYRLQSDSSKEKLIAWVRTRPVHGGRLDRWFQLPQPTWFLRLFVNWHLDRTTGELNRLLNRRIAVGLATESEAAALDSVEKFRAGLPPVRKRTWIALLIVAAFTVGRFVLKHFWAILSKVPVLQNTGGFDDDSLATNVHGHIKPAGVAAVQEDAAKLVDKVGHAVGTDVSSVGKLLDAFAGASLAEVLLVIVGVLFALYVVLRPLVPAFRIKRLLFNLAGDDEARDVTTARWHVSHSSGVYTLERSAFASLGAQPPREPALDLVVPGLLWVSFPTALAAFLLRHPGHVYTGWEYVPPLVGFGFAVLVGVTLLAISAARLAWLVRAGRRRNSDDDCEYPAYEVESPEGRRAKLRDPFLVVALSYFVPYYLPIWWYCVNRQMQSFAARPGSDASGPFARGRAFISLLAFMPVARSLVVPSAVSLLRGSSRLNKARGSPTGRRSRRRQVATALALYLGGYLLVLLPIANVLLFIEPLAPPRIPLLDDWTPFFDSPLLFFISLFASTSVLGFFAGRFQQHWNDVLRAHGSAILEGPGARARPIEAREDQLALRDLPKPVLQ